MTSRWRRRLVPIFGIPLGLLAAGAAIWQGSYAAFYKTTTNGTNSWAAGTVDFGTNSPATAMFSITNAKPGSTSTQCVKLSYTGSLTAPVKLYVKNADVTGTGLGTYLTLQINEGSGNNASCSDFNQSANDYNATGMSDTTKTIATFNTATESYGDGVGAWTASTVNTTKTYEFIWQLQDDNNAQGLTANVTFTWEAQNN